MLCYFDTSALLKKYVVEEGSSAVRSLFENREMITSTSSITCVEGCHVICRKGAEERIPRKILQKLLREFLRDMAEIKIINYSPLVIKMAQKIIKAHVVKTLDAIHIASALILKRSGDLKINFVSSDDQQTKIAAHYKLHIVNPMA